MGGGGGGGGQLILGYNVRGGTIYPRIGCPGDRIS